MRERLRAWTAPFIAALAVTAAVGITNTGVAGLYLFSIAAVAIIVFFARPETRERK